MLIRLVIYYLLVGEINSELASVSHLAFRMDYFIS